MLTVGATWDRYDGGGWRYKIPGVPYTLVPSRKHTSIVSSNAALAQEAKAMAAAVGV